MEKGNAVVQANYTFTGLTGPTAELSGCHSAWFKESADLVISLTINPIFAVFANYNLFF